MMGVAPFQNNGAKDAARNEGEGAPVKHTSPTKGIITIMPQIIMANSLCSSLGRPGTLSIQTSRQAARNHFYCCHIFFKELQPFAPFSSCLY